jgi:hypothetical protein
MNLKHHLKLDKFYSIKNRVEKAISKPIDTYMDDYTGTQYSGLELYQPGEKKPGNIIGINRNHLGEVAFLDCNHDVHLGCFQRPYNIGDYLACPVCANIAGQIEIDRHTGRKY